MGDNILTLVDVVKVFNDQEAVKKISIDIKKGEFLTLLGPSGCGKTTTLRMIAGFENPTSGTIILEGEPVEGKEPHERNVNTVFQNYALFPHMNVFDNIAYGLKIKKVKKDEIHNRVGEMLALVQLQGYERRKPEQLSGGQKQRVAIARALINNPKVLLLDEPLGALDLKLRKQMQIELKRLQKKLAITFIYVTHDQEEALLMSDRIAVMNKGVIEQIGSPEEIYEKPKTKFVADFIGESNLLEGTVDYEEASIISIKFTEDSIIPFDKNHIKGNTSFKKNDKLYISIRPERILYSTIKIDSYKLKATIKELNYVGSVHKIVATLSSGQDLVINDFSKRFIELEIGKELFINWEDEDISVVS